MVVSLAQAQKIQFYESKNLLSWTLTGTFSVSVKDDSVWECPDLFKVKCPLTGLEKWVLIVNVNPGGY